MNIWLIVGPIITVAFSICAIYLGWQFYYNSEISPNNKVYDVAAEYRSRNTKANLDDGSLKPLTTADV